MRTMREVFEAWHEKRFGWKPNHRVSGSGNYHDGNAQGRWMTWQAALEIDPSTGVSAKMPPNASDNELLAIVKGGPEWKHFGMSNEEAALIGIRACRASTEAAKATGTAGELPPMPSPDLTTLGNRQFFTPEQMRAYGQQCAEAASKQLFEKIEELEARLAAACSGMLAQAEAARQPAPALPVKTWQERLRKKFPEMEDRNLFALGHLERAMEAEIADLRAALQKPVMLGDSEIKMISYGHRIGSEVAVKFARAILEAATRSQP